MKQVWFTSDTHFGHANIIKYCKRPFSSVKEMDEAIIERWNSVVGPSDDVYHLGDFIFSKTIDNVNKVKSRLNGNLTVISGNHDGILHKMRPNWFLRNPFYEVRINGNKITLCHYALRTWNGSHWGSYHLYGHTHGTLQDNPNSRSFDVGVDCWNFTPINFDLVVETMNKKDFVPIDLKEPEDKQVEKFWEKNKNES